MTEKQTFFVRIALLWVLLELIAATQVRTAAGSSVAWSWLRAVADPAVWTVRQIGDLSTDLLVGLRDMEQLLADNQRLRLELEASRAHNMLLEEDRAALTEASTLLAAVSTLEESAIAGRCIYRSLHLGSMQVRVETDRPIHRDTPAVSANGLVGRVVRSSRRTSWLELIIHPAAAVAVQTRDGTVHGLATGSGSLELEVEYVARTASLLRGDLLFTSGSDGIYPPGVPVAKVVRIRESDATFLEVVASPLAELPTIRVVLLLPDWAPGAFNTDVQ
jgi:rod shape-determining protein MreC